MARKLKVEVQMDDKKATAALGNLEKKGKGVGTSLSKGLGGVQATLGQIAIAAAAVAAAYKSIEFVINTIDEEAASQRRLATAMKATGQFTDGAFASLKNYAGELQQATTFGNELLQNLLANAIAMGASNDEAEKMVKAAISISETYGLDVTGAVALVSKTVESSTNALVRYGVNVDKTTTRGEQLDDVMRQVAAGFELAKDKANTMKGAAKKLSNTFGDLIETIVGGPESIVEGLLAFDVATNVVTDTLNTDLTPAIWDANTASSGLASTMLGSATAAQTWAFSLAVVVGLLQDIAQGPGNLRQAAIEGAMLGTADASRADIDELEKLSKTIALTDEQKIRLHNLRQQVAEAGTIDTDPTKFILPATVRNVEELLAAFEKLNVARAGGSTPHTPPVVVKDEDKTGKQKVAQYRTEVALVKELLGLDRTGLEVLQDKSAELRDAITYHELLGDISDDQLKTLKTDLQTYQTIVALKLGPMLEADRDRLEGKILDKMRQQEDEMQAQADAVTDRVASARELLNIFSPGAVAEDADALIQMFDDAGSALDSKMQEALRNYEKEWEAQGYDTTFDDVVEAAKALGVDTSGLKPIDMNTTATNNNTDAINAWTAAMGGVPSFRQAGGATGGAPTTFTGGSTYGGLRGSGGCGPEG